MVSGQHPWCVVVANTLSLVSQQFTVPAAAWARIKEIEGSPTMSPYQCSKLNPEIEMTVRQLQIVGCIVTIMLIRLLPFPWYFLVITI